MKITQPRLVWLISLLVLPLTFARASVPLLGLSLGGKFPSIKQCTISQIGSNSTMCWIAAPTRSKDGMLGQINFPNADTRPSWAAHGTFEVSTNSAGELETLSVSGAKFSKRDEILNSIGARFGQSSHESTIANGDLYDSWSKGPVYITLLCSRQTGCYARFTSEEGNRKALARIAARKAKDANRPASP